MTRRPDIGPALRVLIHDDRVAVGADTREARAAPSEECAPRGGGA